MKTFTYFREINEHEGEAWTFWLQRDGNEDALLALDSVIDAYWEEETEPAYELSVEDTLTETQVDLLCEYSEEGYYATHNKVTGTLRLPDGLTVDTLYKGGVKDLFR